jgi:membrane-bound metal-dependent hydrolase YbcI (DUF457 family)
MTHQIAGVGLAAVAGAALDVPTTTAVVLVSAAWLGSLLPDADMAGSRVYRRTRVERRHLLARAVGALVRLPLRLLVLLPHRGFTHSLAACALAAVAVTALVGLVAPTVATAAGIGLAIGYGAHIAADGCTPSGVPLLAPVSKQRHWLLPKPARIPTGSLREYAAAAVMTVSLLAAALLFAA